MCFIPRMAIILALTFSVSDVYPNSLTTDFTKKNARIQAIPEFMSWARENGAQFNKKFSLEAIDGFGLGIVARESISEGERYLTINSQLIIGRDTVLRDENLASAIWTLPRKVQQDTKLLLILFLLHHKHAQKEDSFWWPYIRILPADYGESPIFWEEDRLSALKGSYAFTKVISHRIELKDKFETLKTRLFDRFPELFPGAAADYGEYLWAVWTMSSRLFYIEGLTPREHLVPLADMINCLEPSKPSNTAFVETGPGKNKVQLRSDRSVAAGDQILESYGRKSGFETLYFEGFLLEPPANDCVWIDLASGEAEAPSRWRCVGTHHVQKIPGLTRLRASVENALLKNPFDREGETSDALEIRFRRQEKHQLHTLIHTIDKESKTRQELGTATPDPALPLPSRPTGFTLGGWCGDRDSQCLQKKASALNHWAENLGAMLKVKVAPVPDMRMGAIATMPIAVGDPYIKMPPEALLDENLLAKSPLLPYLEEVNRSLQRNNEKPLIEYERMRILLLIEARMADKSFFAPYLNSLPEDFADSPVTWSQDDLRLLTFSRAGAP